ncbi:MAG: hypothetical protein QOD66_1496 [Solirubrobacteraceae bacterium]|jgi:hypothetical protein|nr:hypothetical protein [Solirubrobacteraceae bacterium]
MSFFDSILRDLRERKLWPVALAMVVALVAVPVLLSKSGRAATPPPVSPPLAATTSPGTAVPAVSVRTVPLHSRLRGHARDPFAQPKQKTVAARKVATTPQATTKPTTTSTTGTTTTSQGTTTTGATSPSGTGGSGSGTGSAPTTPAFPTAPRKPAPTGLSATQSYHVTLAMTNSAGGLDTSDPLERLSILPNDQEPLLVELGVLKGGHRVLFAAEPQTIVSGPGKCTPGPVDCEILSLAPGQIEQLSTSSPTGTVAVAKFAVTEIKADGHPTVAAADRARRSESAAGRRLLSQSSLSALSLFAYRPSLGAVVDLRNLSVGGN